MNAQPKKTWIISDDNAARVEELLADGVVADFDEIVAAGIKTIEEEPLEIDEATFEREVVPALERIDRDPSCLIPSDEAWARINARLAERRGKD
jgi:hypothetical protein